MQRPAAPDGATLPPWGPTHPAGVRIAVQTWGSQGDIRPCLALAAHLVGRGHQVRLAISALDGRDYRAWGHRTGVEVLQGPSAVVPTDATPALLALPATQQLPVLLQRFLLPEIPAMAAAAAAIADGADVALTHCMAVTLRMQAERRGLPWASIAFWPGMVPGPFHPPYPLPGLGVVGNAAAWRLCQLLLDRQLVPPLRPLWRAAGLPSPRRSYRDVWYSPHLNLIAASPTLCGLPARWERTQLTGRWEFPEDPAPLAPEIVRFLDAAEAAGEPPVYWTLGSLQAIDPTGAFERFRAAARLVGGRAIINAGLPDAPPLQRLDEHTLLVSQLPHRAVLPRCRAIVHHGGAGTTHAGLAAGIPAVVVAILEEQVGWGLQLARLGVAGPPLRYAQADPAALAAAVRHVVADPGLGARARSLAARMTQEDGLAAAGAAIEALAHHAAAAA